MSRRRTAGSTRTNGRCKSSGLSPIAFRLMPSRQSWARRLKISLSVRASCSIVTGAYPEGAA
eukprot:6986003-Heterocapsa_arctica.AAC.1